MTGGNVGGGHQLRPGLSVEYGKKLRAGQDVAFIIAKIGSGISDHCAGSVNSPVGGLAGDLGLSVTVEVIDHELGVMGAFADVNPQVYSPPQRAVHFVRFEDRGIGVEAAMFANLYERAVKFAPKRGWEYADGGWVLETNDAMNKLCETHNGHIHKRFRFYERKIKT